MNNVLRNYTSPLPGSDYTPRLIDRRLERLFAQLPAILVTGPRATGKTTTAERHVNTVVRLERAAQAVAFEADPDAALRARRSRSCSTSDRPSPPSSGRSNDRQCPGRHGR